MPIHERVNAVSDDKCPELQPHPNPIMLDGIHKKRILKYFVSRVWEKGIVVFGVLKKLWQPFSRFFHR